MKTRLAIIGFTVLLVNCGGARGPDLSGLGSSSGSVSNPPVGVTTEDAFYVRIFDQGYFPYYLNKAAAAWGTDCSVGSTLSSQSISCYLDVNEMDLYHQGFPNDDHIKIQYNVPAAMCDYFSFMPAWYYNKELGKGPAAIRVDMTKDTDGNLLSMDCTVDSVLYSGCTGIPEISIGANGIPECNYGCCVGSYSLTIFTTVTGGSATVQGPTDYNWPAWATDTGFKQCLGGQARTNWEHYTRGGFPVAAVSYVNDLGLNRIYQLVPPINDPNGGFNVEVANYYFDVSHTHTGYVLARSTDLPYAIDPVDDVTGDDLSAYTASEAYDFRCLDKNHEVKNRIRLYIRAWNTYADFLTYGTSGGVTYAPNVVGVEGTHCAGVLGYCDDYVKWDSVVGVGHFSRDLVGPYAAPLRTNYFPNERYSDDP